MYILVSGEVEIYLSLGSDDLILDTLTVTGSIIGMQNVLCKGKFTFQARAKNDVTMLSVSN